MAKSAQKSDLLAAFLTELASQLMKFGLGAPMFSAAMQLSYVRAASRHARLRNSRLNQSAIAAKTGLSRPQVGALLKKAASGQSLESNHLSSLVNGWLSDPPFINKDGTPKSLPLRGATTSFQALARKFGSDITPRALLNELSDRKLVHLRKERVTLTKHAVASAAQQRQFEKLCGALAAAMSAPGSLDVNMKASSRELQFPALDTVSRIILRKRVKQGVDALFSDIENVTAALSLNHRGNKRAEGMSKISLLVISQE